MEIKMTKQTLLLAAAAVLSLSAGSAFAEGDGSGIPCFPYTSGDAAPVKAMPAPQPTRVHGQAAGDVTRAPRRWIEYTGTGG